MAQPGKLGAAIELHATHRYKGTARISQARGEAHKKSLPARRGDDQFIFKTQQAIHMARLSLSATTAAQLQIDPTIIVKLGQDDM